MAPSPPLDVVLAFVEQINRHDVDRICGLMTDDHELIDSLGSVVRGLPAMRQAWIGYFYLIPDYRIAVSHSFAAGDSVAVFGSASGTYAPGGAFEKGKSWCMPLAIRGTVRDDRVARWEVYADNEPVRNIISALGGTPRTP
jgi:ketosteroid isomerase-like protein